MVNYGPYFSSMTCPVLHLCFHSFSCTFSISSYNLPIGQNNGDVEHCQELANDFFWPGDGLQLTCWLFLLQYQAVKIWPVLRILLLGLTGLTVDGKSMAVDEVIDCL